MQTLYRWPEQHLHEPVRIAFLVEGETDTWRLWQEIGANVDIYGLPGIESWKREWASEFNSYDRVYVLLDNDQDYIVAGRVDHAWQQIRDDLGAKARRVKYPQGVKDACEFFAIYDLASFKTLLKSPPVSQYKALSFGDMDKPIPMDWLVEGLLGQGDIAIMFGPPYVGKSVLSMSLAAAVSRGEPTWLGLPVKSGRVLYIDEENPITVIRSRLHRLGIRPEHEPNLRYLHEQAVRLDRDPEKLLEEALNFEPKLIVIDSLTRIHTKDENSAGEMSALFNDGIKPLARKTGATTVILHHANKVQEDSAYKRMRGSADIGGVIDNGLDVVMANAPGFVTINQFKVRNGLPHPPIFAQFKDTPNGLRVVTDEEAPPPF